MVGMLELPDRSVLIYYLGHTMGRFNLATYVLGNFFELFLQLFCSFCFLFQNFCYLDVTLPGPLIFVSFSTFIIFAILHSRKFCQLYFSNPSTEIFISVIMLLISKNFYLFCECSIQKIVFLFHGFIISLFEDMNDFFSSLNNLGIL